MSRKPKEQKAKPVYQSCNIKFPERVWELTDNGWSSRPAMPADLLARADMADSLNAVILP